MNFFLILIKLKIIKLKKSYQIIIQMKQKNFSSENFIKNF